MTKRLKTEVRIALEESALRNDVLKLGEPSLYACPECHGVLMKIKEGNRTRFRCHTGHAFSLESLLADLSESSEEALWNALRSLEEVEFVLQYMATHLEEAGEEAAAYECLAGVQNTKQRSTLVRQAIFLNKPSPENEALLQLQGIGSAPGDKR